MQICPGINMQSSTAVHLTGRLLSLLLLSPVLFRMLRADRAKELLVLSHLPVGSIRVDWHRVNIMLTGDSLRPSLILFSCCAVSLAYCSLPCCTFQWGLPCCIFRYIFLSEKHSFLMKSFDTHMKVWIENETGLLQSHHEPCVESAYLQDWMRSMRGLITVTCSNKNAIWWWLLLKYSCIARTKIMTNICSPGILLSCISVEKWGI